MSNESPPPETAGSARIRIRKPLTVVNRLKDTPLTPRLLVGLALIGGIVFASVFAPYVAPADPNERFDKMVPPNSHSVGDFNGDGSQDAMWHPLGTDSFGRDILSRTIFGARVSLLVAAATVVIALSVGTALGLLGGFYGGAIDRLVSTYVDIQLAFPELILAIAMAAVLGGSGVWTVVAAIGIAYVSVFTRLVRGETLALREREYVDSARALGYSDFRIMTTEVLPNAIGPIVVEITLIIPAAIIAEAALSFIGLGVTPTTPTWGLMMANGRSFLTQAWWIVVMPGIALAVTSLTFVFVGEELRQTIGVERRVEV